jgi:hypothetical protein
MKGKRYRAGLRRKELLFRPPGRHGLAATAYSFKLSKTFFSRLIPAGTSNA